MSSMNWPIPGHLESRLVEEKTIGERLETAKAFGQNSEEEKTHHRHQKVKS